MKTLIKQKVNAEETSRPPARVTRQSVSSTNAGKLDVSVASHILYYIFQN